MFLIGKMDPVWIKEKLAKECLKFEIHDKDEADLNKLKKNVDLIEIPEEKPDEDKDEDDGKGKKKKGKKKKEEKPKKVDKKK